MRLLPAAATSLCTGYAACQEAGYSHAGYRQASGEMFWQMYAGHNCTNYVAYRMVQSGMPNSRPWQGSGNASNWGVALSSVTDQTPRVGAVAWWKAGVPPAGSSGHLAYVEEVISSTEIIVSEDYWGGDFHWRRISKGGTGWPSGFIHLNDTAIEPTKAPVVLGRAAVDQPLEARPGTWTPTPANFKFQWFAGDKLLEGQSGQTYVPTASDRGKPITVKVTASRPGFAPSTAEASTEAVAPGTFVQTTPPSIAGVPEVDQRLTLQPAAWEPAPANSLIQWYVDGTAVPGATTPTFDVTQAAVDKVITATTTASESGYRRATATTAPTSPVVIGTVAVLEDVTIRGKLAVGRTLRAEPATLQPSDAESRYTWMRDGTPIPGATGTRYSPGPDDIGRRLSVLVEHTRRSYRTAQEVVELPGVVTTKPSLLIQHSRTPSRAVLVVKIQAPGVRHPTGTLTATLGGQTQTSQVTRTRNKFVFSGLKPGQRRLTVQFSGTQGVGNAVSHADVGSDPG